MRGLKAQLPGWLTPELQPPRSFTYNDTGIDTDEALDDSETGIDCDADATTAIPVGSIIKIDTEFMFVTATGTTLTVVRPNPVAHDTNADIYKKVNNCVLWLPGQDGPQSATIRDRSGYNNHGTITGAVWARLPSGLWYLDFDGINDGVTCGDSDSLTLASGFTFRIWARIDDDGTASEYMFCRYDHESTEYEWAFDMHILTAGAGLDFFVRDDTGGGSRGRSDADGVTTFKDKWTHFVGVYNGGTTPAALKLYANGVQVDDTDYTGGTFTAIRNTTAQTRLGGRDHATSQRFDGGLVLPMQTSAQWTQAEALADYQQTRHLFGV